MQFTALPEAFWWMVGAVAVYSRLEAGNIYNYVWWSSLVRPDLTGLMRQVPSDDGASLLVRAGVSRFLGAGTVGFV